MSQETAQFKIDYLEKSSGSLTEWESNFIESISDQLYNGRTLTEKQIETLDGIWEKY